MEYEEYIAINSANIELTEKARKTLTEHKKSLKGTEFYILYDKKNSLHYEVPVQKYNNNLNKYKKYKIVNKFVY